MNTDDIISKMRLVRKVRPSQISKTLELQIQHYYQNLAHHCFNAQFVDKGYYYRHNGDIYLCSMKELDKADFRAIECEQCHQEILLMNTGQEGWDQIDNVNSEEHVHMKRMQ